MRRFILAAATALAVAVGVVSAPAAMAAPVVYAGPITISTNADGSTAAATNFQASATTTASALGVCARSSAGNVVDFPKRTNVTMPAWTNVAVSSSRALPAGTYTATPCAQLGTTWVTVYNSSSQPYPAKSFTVGTTTAPAPTSPVAAPTTPPAVTTTTTMPSSAPAGWTRLSGEDFGRSAALGQFGTVYGTAWNGYVGSNGDTSGNGDYNPDGVLSVANGILNAHLYSTANGPQVAAPMPRGYSSQLYGRVEFRARADSSLVGYKQAPLFWPSSGDWADGEIDVAETGNTDFTSKPYTVSKQLGNYDSVFKSAAASPYTMADWHTYAMEWTPTAIKFFVDGVQTGAITDPAFIPHTKMRFVYQIETKISGTAPASSVAGNVQIDWITLDSYTP